MNTDLHRTVVLSVVTAVALTATGCFDGERVRTVTVTRAPAPCPRDAQGHRAVVPCTFSDKEVRAAVTQTAYDYLRPPKAAQGGRACALLMPEEHQRLDDRGGCAVVVNRFGKRLRKGREIVVLNVQIDRQLGKATASFNADAIRGRPPIIELSYMSGAWRVSKTGL